MADPFVWLNLGAALALFALGLYALVAREGLLRVLLGLEIMGKGATLSLLSAGHALGDLGRAQAMVIVVIAIETVVVAIALALLVRVERVAGRLDVRGIRRLTG
ncbi:MAG TPA: NADH-quinone oxidoreductase subunit K [Thermoplasmata archaeon]|nr:NADH-quinone oxidoreductase subunit K [Thermoplasmata archaeon]